MKEKYTLTNIQMRMLMKFKQDGDKETRNELIKSLLYLVPNIAVKYSDGTCDMNDLIQSGYEGLIKAINNYAFSASNSFKEYLNSYINYYIKKCYNSFNDTPDSINIKDCQNTPADISIEEDYLKKEALESIYSCINQDTLTAKQLCALSNAYNLDLPNVESLRLSRKSKYQHKAAAISKIKNIIIK